MYHGSGGQHVGPVAWQNTAAEGLPCSSYINDTVVRRVLASWSGCQNGRHYRAVTIKPLMVAASWCRTPRPPKKVTTTAPRPAAPPGRTGVGGAACRGGLGVFRRQFTDC